MRVLWVSLAGDVMRSRIRDNNEDDDDDSVRKQFVAQRFE